MARKTKQGPEPEPDSEAPRVHVGMKTFTEGGEGVCNVCSVAYDDHFWDKGKPYCRSDWRRLNAEKG